MTKTVELRTLVYTVQYVDMEVLVCFNQYSMFYLFNVFSQIIFTIV